ncbi:MAG: BrnT family toxin [Acidobacteria bacterium]|nr:BrnT family toxin [Acidobacteriota bacterium]
MPHGFPCGQRLADPSRASRPDLPFARGGSEGGIGTFPSAARLNDRSPGGPPLPVDRANAPGAEDREKRTRRLDGPQITHYTILVVRFEWDEAKREANIRKHGIDFLDVPSVFDGPNAVAPDDRFDYEEERFRLIGHLEGRPVVIIFSSPSDGVIRIISARRATQHEERLSLQN